MKRVLNKILEKCIIVMEKSIKEDGKTIKNTVRGLMRIMKLNNMWMVIK